MAPMARTAPLVVLAALLGADAAVSRAWACKAAPISGRHVSVDVRRSRDSGHLLACKGGVLACAWRM